MAGNKGNAKTLDLVDSLTRYVAAARAHLDGQAEAINLLRALQKLNWNSDRGQPRKSAELLSAAISSLAGWPARERKRFLRVISDWLVEELLDCCYNLDEYEESLRFSRAVNVAQRDRDYQAFLASAQGKPASTTQQH
jgi:hypothetical protein